MESEQIVKLLEEAFKDAKESTILMSDPQIIEQLRKDKSPSLMERAHKPPKEILVDTFEKKKAMALDIIDKMPPYIDAGRHSIQSLYEEIKDCILWGTNGAAITLCGIMVEYALKYVIYHWEIPELSVSFDHEKWDMLESGVIFHGAVEKANSMGIINDAEKAYLLDFKTDIRNPYNHYNIKKIVTGVIIPTTRVDINKGIYEKTEIMAEDEPGFFSLAKKWRDSKFVFSVFIETYRIVKVLLARLDKHNAKKV